MVDLTLPLAQAAEGYQAMDARHASKVLIVVETTRYAHARRNLRGTA